MFHTIPPSPHPTSPYSPKESSLSILGPLGLSGSLFLGLLVLDFYHPKNRDLYLVEFVVVLRIFGCGGACFWVIFWFLIFTTLRTVTFI